MSALVPLTASIQVIMLASLGLKLGLCLAQPPSLGSDDRNASIQDGSYGVA